MDGKNILTRMGVMNAAAEPFAQPETVRSELVPIIGVLLAFEVEDGVVTGANLQGGFNGYLKRHNGFSLSIVPENNESSRKAATN